MIACRIVVYGEGPALPGIDERILRLRAPAVNHRGHEGLGPPVRLGDGARQRAVWGRGGGDSQALAADSGEN